MHTENRVARCQPPADGTDTRTAPADRCFAAGNDTARPGTDILAGAAGSPTTTVGRRARPGDHAVVLSLFAALLIGSAGAGLLSAGVGGTILAPSSAPGTLPAADHAPPPWQAAPAPAPSDGPALYRGLHEIARTVTCMVDGEIVKNVVTERAQEKIFHLDPKDRWAAGDNWDYNHAPFVQVKQTLERACCLAAGQVGCNLYMPAPARPKMWYQVMNTLFSGKQMMLTPPPDNGMAQEPDPELAEVFRTGQRLEVSKHPGEFSVLTPVYDSLGQIVAVVEVFTRETAFRKARQ